MNPRDLEPEMEDMLLRLVPNLAAEWEGATEEEIARIEALAGRPLPRFYRWFLLRMGHSMGPLETRIDYSVAAVLAGNAKGSSTDLFLIGKQEDPLMGPVMYDFNFLARDDARVTTGFESFREMLAWTTVLSDGVYIRDQRCCALYEDMSGESPTRLTDMMKSLGFEAPIPTGPLCAVFLRSDAEMVLTAPLDEDLPRFYSIGLGARDKSGIDYILREISMALSTEVKTKEWDPPL